MPSPFALIAAVSIVLAISVAPGRAQAIWRVDGIRFLDIDSAYAAAAPGDVILVTISRAQMGQLSGKGVRIIAGSANLYLFAIGAAVTQIPLGEQFLLSGFHIETSASWPSLEFRDCQGSLIVEHCTGVGSGFFAGRPTMKPLEFHQCRDVQLYNCSWIGLNGGSQGPTICTSGYGRGGTGVVAIDSRITMTACTFTGGHSAVCSLYCLGCGPSSTAGGHGIQAMNSNIVVFESVLRGSVGSTNQPTSAPPGYAIHLANSHLWISDPPATGFLDTIFGDARSSIRSFGVAPSLAGSAAAIHENVSLPEFRMQWTNSVGFSFHSAWPVNGAPFVIGASFGSGFQPLEGYGGLGVWALNTMPMQSVALLTGAYDMLGEMRLVVRVPQDLLTYLRYQEIRVQLATLDGNGRLIASPVQLFRFPG